MKWFTSIEPLHVQRWSRLFRYQYTQCVRTWCSTNRRGFSASQIAAYDAVKLNRRTVCYWYELVTQLYADGYNPLQVVKYAFEQSLIHSHAEYPRPKQLRHPRTTPDMMNAQYEQTTEVSIRSDLVVLSRTSQLTAAVVGPNVSQEQTMEVIAEVIGPKLFNCVIRNAVLGSYDTTPMYAIACEFMTAPQVYLDLIPTLIPPKLRSIPTMEGTPVG